MFALKWLTIELASSSDARDIFFPYVFKKQSCHSLLTLLASTNTQCELLCKNKAFHFHLTPGNLASGHNMEWGAGERLSILDKNT